MDPLWKDQLGRTARRTWGKKAGYPPRSGGGRGPPPEVVVEEDPPPKASTRQDQLRSTAGQAGGMP